MIDIATVGALGAFVGGVVSFLSPCSLILLPGYLSFIGGHKQQGVSHSRHSIGYSLWFVAGLLSFFIALGVGSRYLARFMWHYQTQFQVGAGLFIAGFGLMTMVSYWRGRHRSCRTCAGTPSARPKSAVACFGLGVAFAFGRSPCAGPILSAIIAYGAVESNAFMGNLMLSLYAAGFVVPFLLMAFYFERLRRFIPKLSRIGRTLMPVFSAALVAFGTLMASGTLPWLSYLLSLHFPSIVHLG